MIKSHFLSYGKVFPVETEEYKKIMLIQSN